MNCQFINLNQINNSDYLTLVHMLGNPITPDVRKQILQKLTEMNDQLISTLHQHQEIDLDDIIDNLHQEMDPLDEKLDRIKKLQNSLRAYKKQKRKDRVSFKN